MPAAFVAEQPLHPQPAHPQVRAVIDGRPPGRTWSPEQQHDPEQQELLFESASLFEGGEPLGPPAPVGHQVHVVSQPWMSAASTALPDARSWSSSLALAVAETLQGRRPVGQLSRWVDDQVLATVTVATRSGRSRSRDSAPFSGQRPARLRSVHLQFPRPDVVEASAHVQLDGRTVALALRLEAWFDRWLCTALEFGPRDLGL
jgi:hypothetical protein